MYRSLVVDDDPEVCSFLGTVLAGIGVHATTALDGGEAEQRLRGEPYDVLFLDLRLPVMSGSLVLHAIQNGLFKKPKAIVLMTASGVAEPTADDLQRLGVTAFLRKPFSPHDVRRIMEATVGPTTAGEPKSGPVLLCGHGLWIEALASVVHAGKGHVVVEADPAKVFERALAERAAAVVLGAPLTNEQLLGACSVLRERLAGLPVLVALPRSEPGFQAVLRRMGATKAVALPLGFAEISADVTHHAKLSRRLFARVPLESAVWLKENDHSVFGAYATDLSEGGLGVHKVTGAPPRSDVRVEFSLPGESDLLSIHSEVAWLKETDSGLRAGVRFTTLDERDRMRIRSFVECAWANG